jgi:hypothetical protein
MKRRSKVGTPENKTPENGLESELSTKGGVTVSEVLKGLMIRNCYFLPMITLLLPCCAYGDDQGHRIQVPKSMVLLVTPGPTPSFTAIPTPPIGAIHSEDDAINVAR